MLNRAEGADEGIDTLAGFHRIDFKTIKSVVIAVSGGGDSLALLLQAKAYLDRFGDAPRLFAATVDHSLRPESVAEAQRVAAICSGLDLPHTTLRWDGDKQKTGLSEAARNARYDLLGAFALEVGAGLVLTGHTLDDQRETVFMRRKRAGGGGLAGIPEATFWQDGPSGVWFVRPLLGVRRCALRAYLRRLDVSWVEDPTNQSVTYERVRARKALAELPDDDPVIMELDGTRQSEAEKRLSLSSRAAAMMLEHVRQVSPGLFFLPDALLLDADRAAVVHVLRIMLAHVGGRTHLADLARAEAMAERLAEPQRFDATLSRTQTARRSGGAYLLREARNIGGWGESFDNRFVAGTPPSLPPAKGKHPPALVHQALARHPQGVDGERRLLPLLNPWAKLVPILDLDAAKALALIAGTVNPPAVPLRTSAQSAN